MFRPMYGQPGCGQVIPVPGCNLTQVCPPVCHPPINFVKQNCITHIIPNIYPIHETTVNTHVFKQENFFPQSAQTINQVYNQPPQQVGPGPYPFVRRGY